MPLMGGDVIHVDVMPLRRAEPPRTAIGDKLLEAIESKLKQAEDGLKWLRYGHTDGQGVASTRCGWRRSSQFQAERPFLSRFQRASAF